MASFHIECHLKYEVKDTTDFIFMIQAAHCEQQHIRREELQIPAHLPQSYFTDITGLNRVMRVHAPKNTELSIVYRAEVEVYELDHNAIKQLPELNVKDLPDEVMSYLLSSRYCPTEPLMEMAQRTFGHLPRGYSRVNAINDWVHENIAYVVGASDARTTAVDVLTQRAGVCRDFAHVAITLCRCLSIPARMVVGYVEFRDPPPDFHAIFEAYLGGQWVLFDPTKMEPTQNVVRIATGRDAVELAFSSYYGDVNMLSMQPLVCDAIPGQAPQFIQGDTLVAVSA